MVRVHAQPNRRGTQEGQVAETFITGRMTRQRRLGIRRALTTVSPAASRGSGPREGVVGEIQTPYAAPCGENATPEMPNLTCPRACIGARFLPLPEDVSPASWRLLVREYIAPSHTSRPRTVRPCAAMSPRPQRGQRPGSRSNPCSYSLTLQSHTFKRMCAASGPRPHTCIMQDGPINRYQHFLH